MREDEVVGKVPDTFRFVDLAESLSSLEDDDYAIDPVVEELLACEHGDTRSDRSTSPAATAVRA